jgi:hypothetical protein
MAASPSLTAGIAATDLEAGAYVTDGYNLFAILSVSHPRRAEPMVTFEDCRTLEMLVCPLGDFERRHLELVRPRPAAAA